MKTISKLLVSVPFSVALLVPPVASLANAAPIQDRDDHNNQRYYDKEHKDYHQWNSTEDRYWHQYLTSEHRKYVAWDKASAEQQQAYWNWRHSHEDHH